MCLIENSLDKSFGSNMPWVAALEDTSRRSNSPIKSSPRNSPQKTATKVNIKGSLRQQIHIIHPAPNERLLSHNEKRTVKINNLPSASHTNSSPNIPIQIETQRSKEEP